MKKKNFNSQDGYQFSPQLDDKKINSIIKIQNAIRNKQAINIFSTKYVERLMNRKKKIEELSSLYKPSTDLVFKPFQSTFNFEKNKEKRLLEQEQEKQLHDERLNKLNSYLSIHPSSLYDYQSLPKEDTKSKFKLHFGIQ